MKKSRLNNKNNSFILILFFTYLQNSNQVQGQRDVQTVNPISAAYGRAKRSPTVATDAFDSSNDLAA